MSFIKLTILKFLCLFIVLILIKNYTYSEINKQIIEVKNLNDDTLRINIKQDDIIIFYNNLTCYNCFLELNDYISKNRDNFKNIYCVIQNSRKTKYSERILLKGIKDIFKADNYFFDITNNDNLENSEIISNLFLVYHIDKTPAIYIIKNFLNFTTMMIYLIKVQILRISLKN